MEHTEHRQRLQVLLRAQLGHVMDSSPGLESDLLDLMVLSGWSDGRCEEFIGRLSHFDDERWAAGQQSMLLT